MPRELVMPALGMAQDEGVFLRWLKEEGETVQTGEPLMEVATDSVDVQAEAPASGLLTAVTAQGGDGIPVARCDRTDRRRGGRTARQASFGAASHRHGRQ